MKVLSKEEFNALLAEEREYNELCRLAEASSKRVREAMHKGDSTKIAEWVASKELPSPK